MFYLRFYACLFVCTFFTLICFVIQLFQNNSLDDNDTKNVIVDHINEVGQKEHEPKGGNFLCIWPPSLGILEFFIEFFKKIKCGMGKV